MKRWIAVVVGLMFVISVSATSFAAGGGKLKAQIKQVKGQILVLNKKLKAAKGKAKAALQKQLEAKNAQLQSLESQLSAAKEAPMAMEKPMAAPKAMEAPASAPMVKAPPKPVYGAPSAAAYEIAAEVGYVSQGVGVSGQVNFPNILNDVAKSLSLDQVGLGNIGLSVGAGFISGKNNAGASNIRYAPVFVNGIVTLYAEPSYSIYAEGGPNFTVASSGRGTGKIGGQVGIGGDWAIPELGGKLYAEVGFLSVGGSLAGRSSGVAANAGYKFGF